MRWKAILAALILLIVAHPAPAATPDPLPPSHAMAPAAPAHQSEAEAAARSRGCESCHGRTDAHTMHDVPGVVLGCTDCHGGDANVVRPPSLPPGSSAYKSLTAGAHVLPRYPEAWNYPDSANPPESYTLLNRESPAFIRFMNPSDYRVVDLACGSCHLREIHAARRSLMATTAMFWGGASYNNGLLPYKRYILGEAYTRDGEPASIVNPVKPDANMTAKGILPRLLPLPAWETTPPADVFRVFERGGRRLGNVFPETALPNAAPDLELLEEPGRPDIRQSNRGLATGNRIAVPVLNLHKTRLNDPLMWFLGTNDNPGDFRSSGCAACHVVYANDADPTDSGPYARFGHWGLSQTDDPTIPHDERGHPLKHVFTRSIPTSQCMVCHMHQPNMFLNTYLGYTMWDYESDAPAMWPKKQHYPDAEEIRRVNERNPEGAAVRGKWRDPEFLGNVSKLNPDLHNTQFADYHGHGWNFRAVFKKDREGNLLDARGRIVSPDDPDKFHKAVHMASIHAEKGMHCVDCHFAQDNHGNGHIYGEVAEAVEIDCIDCHGTIDSYPTLRTSGPAAPPGGHDLSARRTPDGRLQFVWRGGQLYQRSMLDPKLEWRLSLVKDSVTPGNPHYNRKAARAKLMSTDTGSQHWGTDVAPDKLAHPNSDMMCITCHTSWTTSCAGCHLPIQANWKSARHHYEGGETRAYATYNPQVARDQMFQLGRHGPAKGNRIAPIRSSSALVLSSTDANREHIYVQQPPISAAGFSSQAFAPHFPHTVRTTETKQCDDCHLSKANDNNAIMAQLLLQGTGFVNFVGYHAWVGEEDGVDAVRVTEWDEPQAVIGSYLQRYAYPDDYAAHLKAARELKHAIHHDGGRIGCIQLRGEYLFTAAGEDGFRVYDASAIGNKGFSEKLITAPFSPLGQNTHVSTPDATCMALPTDQNIAPQRNHGPLMRKVNLEQPFHPIYNYAVITDAKQGLILTDVDTLVDREPRNNFLTRAVTWNPDGVLDGARHVILGGYYAYVSTPRGLVVVNLDDPLHPRLAATLPLKDMRASALQFRYLFAITGDGLHVVDVTHPGSPREVPGAFVPFSDAHRVYVARTYAYVAAGSQGLGIVNVARPEHPSLDRLFTADGRIDDARDVVIGAAYASVYAYVADGRNGLRVVQLMAPDTQPRYYGFSPRPVPQLIASYRTPSPALALSRGLERDRAVDETGGQVAIFGRIGSRPFTLPEMQRLYLDSDGKPWFVSDTPEKP